MTRTGLVKFLFLVSLVLVAATIGLRIWQNPGAPSKDGFAGLAPLFLIMLAMRSEKFPKIGFVLCLLGFSLCVFNFVVVISSL